MRAPYFFRVALALVVVVSALIWTAALKAADEKPVAGAAESGNAKAGAEVGAVRRQTLKGFTYFHTSTQTTMEGLGEAIRKIIPELHKAIEDGKVQVAGPAVLIYHGATADPKAEFMMEVGMPVAQGTKASGEFKVREVGEYRCASVLFSGPVKGLGGAFEKLLPAVQDGPGTPTDEAREMYLYFEGAESPNNVIHVSIGLK